MRARARRGASARAIRGALVAVVARMISRRQFIQKAAVVSSGATVTLLITSLGSSTGCSSDDDNTGQTSTTNPTEPAPAPAPSPTPTPTPRTGGCDNHGGIGSRSSVSLAHTHDVCVAGNDLATPPSNGANYATSNNDGHLHSVALTSAQLAALERGETVTTQSSNVAGHTHDFTIKRLA